MKKAYTITPEEYREKQKEINDIDYKYGYDCGRNHSCHRLSVKTPEKVRQRYEELNKECNEMPMPNSGVYFRGTDIYNLWLNRNNDEPITARELYNIVTAIFGEIGDAENRASYEWDGQSTIM
jgi:hypothetical protein